MNKHVESRLKAIQDLLLSHYSGGSGLPNALIGSEREHLVNDYLSRLLPPVYRFGRGAITDSNGNLSGQLEVVMELPLGASFPMPTLGSERLYLAESVAAIVEVKSNLVSQWSEVEETIRKVKILQRDIRRSSALVLESPPDLGIKVTSKIPCYAVGYMGYKSLKALEHRLSTTPIESQPDGVLILESGCFIGVTCKAEGVWGLYALVMELVAQVNAVLQIAYPDLHGYSDVTKLWK